MARILVAEDEPGIAMALEDDLTMEGYDVEVAGDGDLASRRAREGAFEIREAFPSEVFKFRDKGLQLFNALGEVVDRKRFRPRPLRSCACHRMWAKCSPRPLD